MLKTFNGIDCFIQDQDPLYISKKWGLVTNDAAITKDGTTSRLALQHAGYHLACLFSPEHGLSTTGIDGHFQEHHTDQVTGLYVYSLYGNQFKPEIDVMDQLDGILFDLPDIGVRFYTYLWTLSYLLEICQDTGKQLIVLDRPNPLSGNLSLAEGPMLNEEQYSSFIGRWNIPIRHSLTLGELANYWKTERNMYALDLMVIRCRGWKRRQYIDDTDLIFKAPSPAIKYRHTILSYASLCFLEGLNVNEGRGTVLPFQQFGAPWLIGLQFARILSDVGFPGVSFTTCIYRPKSNRYSGQFCEGVRLNITKKDLYRPIQTGLGIIALLFIHFKLNVRFELYRTLANPSGQNHLSLLLGDDTIPKLLLTNPMEVLSNRVQLSSASAWKHKIYPFLLYEAQPDRLIST